MILKKVKKGRFNNYDEKQVPNYDSICSLGKLFEKQVEIFRLV